jgi:hypothetical protein
MNNGRKYVTSVPDVSELLNSKKVVTEAGLVGQLYPEQRRNSLIIADPVVKTAFSLLRSGTGQTIENHFPKRVARWSFLSPRERVSPRLSLSAHGLTAAFFISRGSRCSKFISSSERILYRIPIVPYQSKAVGRLLPSSIFYYYQKKKCHENPPLKRSTARHQNQAAVPL